MSERIIMIKQMKNTEEKIYKNEEKKKKKEKKVQEIFK